MGGPYSYQTGVMKTFHVWDYVIFGLTLGISSAIGLFYAIKDRNRQNTDEYLLGGRRMHYIPVAMSLLSSFISAVTILGTPAEVYVNSTMYWWIAFAFILTALAAAHVYIPVFYNLGITSVFQYIEMRFGHATRMFASGVYLIHMLMYMAIVLYGPSLALNAVTGLSLWGSVIAVGLVCTFYTTLGGMKAVLWADTLQMLVVFAGMILILVQCSVVLGGFDKAWDIADKNGRIIVFEFDPDPRTRHTVWSLVIGGSIFWTSVYGTNQAQVQRTMAVSTLNKTRAAIWLNVPGMASIITISCMVGVVMYAFYAECDPVKFGLVKKPDQLVPLLVMDLLGDLHGLPGLMLSCIFSGSLSTMSSGLNALAAVTLEDFVKPNCCKTSLSPRAATILSKIFVVIYGCIALGVAFLVSVVGKMILQLSYTLFGVLGGPMLGLFTLGMLFPWANKIGGFVGFLTSLIFLLWLGLGTSIRGVTTTTRPPVYTSACNYNISGMSTPVITTLSSNISTTPAVSLYDKYSGLDNLYTLSYMWYSAVGVVTVVVVGLIVSFITGRTDPSKLDPKLICPVFDAFFPYLPEKIKKPLRFGVRHEEVWEEERKAKVTDTEKKSSLYSTKEIRTDNKTTSANQEKQTKGHALLRRSYVPNSKDRVEQNGIDNIGFTSDYTGTDDWNTRL